MPGLDMTLLKLKYKIENMFQHIKTLISLKFQAHDIYVSRIFEPGAIGNEGDNA